MNLDRLISSSGVRIVTAVCALLFTIALPLHLRDPSLEPILVLTIASGITAAAGIVISFRPIYTLWMRFAEGLQKVASVALFGGCYLFMVPFFALIVRFTDPLKLRSGVGADETYWIQRRQGESDPRSYQRMG